MIEAVGDSGTYQRMIVLTSMMCLFGTAFVSFSISFLVSEPTFMCHIKDKPGEFIECSETYACFDLDYSKVEFKFHSWAETKNLVCDKSLLRESGKSLALLINGIVCFISLNMSDLFGRKFVIIVNTIGIMICLLLAYLIDNFHLKMLFIGISYGLQGAFSSLFVFMMNEVSCKFYINFSTYITIKVKNISPLPSQF